MRSSPLQIIDVTYEVYIIFHSSCLDFLVGGSLGRGCCSVTVFFFCGHLRRSVTKEPTAAFSFRAINRYRRYPWYVLSMCSWLPNCCNLARGPYAGLVVNLAVKSSLHAHSLPSDVVIEGR